MDGKGLSIVLPLYIHMYRLGSMDLSMGGTIDFDTTLFVFSMFVTVLSKRGDSDTIVEFFHLYFLCKHEDYTSPQCFRPP